MNLIFWLDTVPVCCKGVFEATARKWDGKTIFLCSGELDENRKKISDESSLNFTGELIQLKEQSDPERFLNEFIMAHLQDIHIFNGYRGPYIDKVLARSHGRARAVVWAERPCPPAWKERYPWALFHVYFALKYRNRIAALLPLGERGVKCYTNYGWPQEKLFPFLYLPQMNECVSPKTESPTGIDRKIKFVYLGRFSAGSKGTDILMQAIKLLTGTNYTLDMVGGYGDLLDETMSWIKENENVHFAGTWPIEEACDRLKDYDVCLVPSKYEGWNVTINEALMAGIGCIATDECVSDELVTSSGAGVVVKAGKPAEFAAAMDRVMKKPAYIQEWSTKAFDYREHMTADTCADYLVRVFAYLFAKSGERPLPPWIKC